MLKGAEAVESEPAALLLDETSAEDERKLALESELVEVELKSGTLALPRKSVLATDEVAVRVPLEAVKLRFDVDVVAYCSGLLLLVVVLCRLWL